MCHFFKKVIDFFALVKTISFFVLFIFRISAMKLCILMIFFSLDICTYCLNISRMWFIKNLLFLKRSHCLRNQETQKWQFVLLKLAKLNYFAYIRPSTTKNIYHFYKIDERVFRPKKKLQREHSRDDFILKGWKFFIKRWDIVYDFFYWKDRIWVLHNNAWYHIYCCLVNIMVIK